VRDEEIRVAPGPARRRGLSRPPTPTRRWRSGGRAGRPVTRRPVVRRASSSHPDPTMPPASGSPSSSSPARCRSQRWGATDCGSPCPRGRTRVDASDDVWLPRTVPVPIGR